MKTVACLLLIAAISWAQPSLRATDPVGNAASYATDVAQGSIFVVFGTNLSGPDVVVATKFPLEVEMNKTSIQFTPRAGGTPISALMIYTTRNQVAGLLPSTAAPGEYDLRVTYNNQTTVPARVRVVARNLGIFTANQAGFGQAQALNRGELVLNRFASGRLPQTQFTTGPATSGMRIDLYGTGLGPDPQSDSTGGTSGDQTAAANVRVRIGTREVPVLYAGRSQGTAGLDQIVFNLPADVETGCTVPVQVLVGTQTSNEFTLAIAPAGQNACRHPFLSEQTLRRVSEGGTFTMGSLSLTKLDMSMAVLGQSFNTSDESFSGSFARFGVGDMANIPGVQTTTIGQCQTFRRRGRSEDVMRGGPPVTPLDAGTLLTLNGPNANNLTAPRDAASKTYSRTLFQTTTFPGAPAQGTPVITQGTYRVTGPGGADVGAFTASVDVPTPVTWTNRASINAVPRSQPLNITWTGGTGAGDNVVVITGVSGSQIGGTDQQPIFDAGVFVCTAPAAAGNFTVPPAVLGVLPASSGDPMSGGIGMLGISITGSENAGRFNAPLTAGGNLDFAQFNYMIGSNKTVAFQ